MALVLYPGFNLEDATCEEMYLSFKRQGQAQGYIKWGRNMLERRVRNGSCGNFDWIPFLIVVASGGFLSR